MGMGSGNTDAAAVRVGEGRGGVHIALWACGTHTENTIKLIYESRRGGRRMEEAPLNVVHCNALKWEKRGRARGRKGARCAQMICKRAEGGGREV